MVSSGDGSKLVSENTSVISWRWRQNGTNGCGSVRPVSPSSASNKYWACEASQPLRYSVLCNNLSAS